MSLPCLTRCVPNDPPMTPTERRTFEPAGRVWDPVGKNRGFTNHLPWIKCLKPSLVVEPCTPLKNDGRIVSWDDEIPKIWKVIK